jgi:stringent starvation protein B
VSSPVLPSTKPYLLRALYEWCNDNGFTPHVVVQVDSQTVVPPEYVRDGQIVLDIGADATGRLLIDNEALQCTVRFGGVARDLWIPVGRIAAIYASENGAGMPFEIEDSEPVTPPEPSSPTPKPGGRPKLQRVK